MDDVKGEVLALVGVPKVVPVLVVPKGALAGVTVVPNVSPVVPVAAPNAGLEKAVVLVVSYCEVAGANGPALAGGVAPNGEALEVVITGAVLCGPPNMFTAGVEVVTPNEFVDWAELKAGVVVVDPPKMVPEVPNAGFSPNIGPGVLPKVAEPPKTGAPPKAGVSDWENIPELKVPEDGVVPNIEFVVCKFEAPPNGLPVDVLAPLNIDVLLDWVAAPLNSDGVEVAALLNTDVAGCDVCGLAKTLFAWLVPPNNILFGCPKRGCEVPPPNIEPDVPNVCAFCPALNVEVFVVAPNTELVLVPPPNTPKLLPKVGVVPTTGFGAVVVLPKIDELLGVVNPPLNGLFWLPKLLFPNTLVVEVLVGVPS